MKHFVCKLATIAAACALGPAPLSAQWERVTHQHYLPASHNWQFRAHYPLADGLFNAFDFGHGILYERLFSEPHAPVERLEVETYDALVRRVLPKPPRLPMPEQAFMPNYARLAPRAKEMFDWAHVLHRQVYDIYADDRVTDKVAAVDDVVDYYLSRRDLAFTVQPKSMAIMDEQYYSKVFRERYPRFNGLIWAYHWLQMAVYEPLIIHATPEERQAGVLAAVARFWDMLQAPPDNLPTEMPMSPAVAPEFTARHPRAAAIFDNLHMMHDVISDILAAEQVTDKRAAIYDAIRQFTDPDHLAISTEEWIAMSLAHGLAAQGGPAIGLIQRPAAGEDHAGHGGDAAAGAHDHAGQAAPPADPHAGHAPPGAAGAAQDSADVAAVVDRYHRALAEGDSTAVLALLTADAVILESGNVETRDEYRAHHLPADIAFARAVPRERGPIAVTVRGDVAWAASTSTSRGEYQDRSINSGGAELMVLVRTADGWRIAAIHWSSRTLRS